METLGDPGIAGYCWGTKVESKLRAQVEQNCWFAVSALGGSAFPQGPPTY
jgi:hypothetical protein